MTFAFDRADPEVARDPSPAYARLRAEDPVHWSPSLGGWMLTRFDDVMAAQRDRRFSADRATPFADRMEATARPDIARMGRMLARWMAFSDPPRHTVLRRLTVAAFTPTAVATLRPRVETLVDGLLDAMSDRRGACDLIGEFAWPLPATVIAHLLGVPGRDLERFRAWSDDIAGVVGGAHSDADRLERGAAALAALETYLGDTVTQRRREGASGALIDALIAARDADAALSEEELVANCALLLFAGHETTTSLIGNGVRLLLERPEQFAALRADPALAAGAVEEILRYEGAAHAISRIAARDIALRGKTIAEGDRVFLMLGAANRDPAVFDDPEVFDIARRPGRHLAFGYGPHFCVGAPLARLEGEIALTRLAARFPDMALAEAHAAWAPYFILRRLARLPLALDGGTISALGVDALLTAGGRCAEIPVRGPLWTRGFA